VRNMVHISPVPLVINMLPQAPVGLLHLLTTVVIYAYIVRTLSLHNKDWPHVQSLTVYCLLFSVSLNCRFLSTDLSLCTVYAFVYHICAAATPVLL